MNERRYDADYLRVGAFMLLILYHVGQYYVADWGWHIKSESQSEFLQIIMTWSNQWRMQLLFLISGLVLALIEPRISSRQLLKVRNTRLGVPLLFGIFVIVPPQLYFQLIQFEGYNDSYLNFMLMYVNPNNELYPQHQHTPLGLATWNHLWYLPYLFVYSVIYVMLKPMLQKINWGNLDGSVTVVTLFLAYISLQTIAGLVVKPYFPQHQNLISDWYSHCIYLTAFFFGYMLARLPKRWDSIREHRRIWLGLAVLHYIILITLYRDTFGFFAENPYAELPILIKAGVQWLIYTNIAAWLFTMIGYAAQYLRKGHAVLTYMNEAILPWYILHQTLIILFAVWMAQFNLNAGIEAVILIVLTVVGCGMGYELVKRNNITRWLFGLKINPSKKRPATRAELITEKPVP